MQANQFLCFEPNTETNQLILEATDRNNKYMYYEYTLSNIFQYIEFTGGPIAEADEGVIRTLEQMRLVVRVDFDHFVSLSS